jgi:hypothetical protein
VPTIRFFACARCHLSACLLGSLVLCLIRVAQDGGPSHRSTPRAEHRSGSPVPGRATTGRWSASGRSGIADMPSDGARRLECGRLTPEREKPRLGRVFHHAPKRTRTSTGHSATRPATTSQPVQDGRMPSVWLAGAIPWRHGDTLDDAHADRCVGLVSAPSAQQPWQCLNLRPEPHRHALEDAWAEAE